MQVHIVLAHPEPTSLNAGLAEAARDVLRDQGHRVTFSDLYETGFDPAERGRHYRERADPTRFSPLLEQRHSWEAGSVPDPVATEIEALEECDLLILQFPIWWHGPPAMMKGWFDRVFLNGVLYTSSKRYDRGHFKGRRALVSVTTGAPQAAFGPGARGGDPEDILWPVHYSLHYMGFEVLEPHIVYGVQGNGYSYRSEDEHKNAMAGAFRD